MQSLQGRFARISGRLGIVWLWFLALLATGSANVSAQEAEKNDKGDNTVVTMPVVEVQASKIPSRQDLQDTLSPGAVSVVYPDDTKGEFKTLPDLLDQIPGVYVRRVSGSGQYTTASIRGSAPSQVNIYIDGVPFNVSSETAADLSTIPITNVERIEVYRGTTPARFSGAPVGGAINIVTKNPTDFGGTVSSGMSSFGGRQYSASTNGPLLDGKILLSIDKQRSDGDFKYDNYAVRDTQGISSVRTGQNSYQTGCQAAANCGLPVTRTRLNNSFSNDNLLTKWQDDNFFVKWSYLYMGRLMPGNVDSPNQTAPQSTIDVPSSLNYNGRRIQKETQNDVVTGWKDSFGDLTTGITLSMMDQNKNYRYPDAFPPLSYSVGGSWSHYQTRRYGAQTDETYQLGQDWPVSQQLEFHSGLYQETLHANMSGLDGGEGNFRHDLRRVKTDFQTQDTLTVHFLDDLEITPIGRLERLQGPTLGTLVPAQGTASGSTDWKPTGTLAVKKYLPAGWQLYGSYGTTVRYPNFYELYGDGFYVQPHTDSMGRTEPVIPEFARNSDIGLGWDGKLNGDWGGHLRLTYFERKTDHNITQMITGIGSTYQNSGSTYQHGVEVETGLDWGKRADLQLAFTGQEGWYRGAGMYQPMSTTPMVAPAGQRIPTLNAPVASADARLNLHFFDGALTTFTEMKFTGRNYIGLTQQTNGNILKSYERPLTTIDLGAHLKLPYGGALSGGVMDMFNQGPKQQYVGLQDYLSSTYCPSGSPVYCAMHHIPRVTDTYPYAENVFYPQQGRTFYATISWTY